MEDTENSSSNNVNAITVPSPHIFEEVRLESSSSTLSGSSDSSISSKVSIKTDKSNDQQERCAICLQPKIMNSEDSTIQVLRCNHSFHKECIEHWFTISQHFVCPVCRTIDREQEPDSAENVTFSFPADVTASDDDSFDYNLEPLFGTFESNSGNVYIFDTQNGVIMLRTFTLPFQISPPAGLHIIPLPSPNGLGPLPQYQITEVPTTRRGRFKQKMANWGNKISRKFQNFKAKVRLYWSVLSYILCYRGDRTF